MKTLYISNIGQLAEAKGLTQRTLAQKAGLAHSTVQRYWAGNLNEARIRLSTLAKLCRALEAQIGDLISEQRAS